jgi:hypothetical protein
VHTRARAHLQLQDVVHGVEQEARLLQGDGIAQPVAVRHVRRLRARTQHRVFEQPSGHQQQHERARHGRPWVSARPMRFSADVMP